MSLISSLPMLTDNNFIVVGRALSWVVTASRNKFDLSKDGVWTGEAVELLVGFCNMNVADHRSDSDAFASEVALGCYDAHLECTGMSFCRRGGGIVLGSVCN